MSSFFDSDKFMFVMMDDGHLAPVHYRELGSKEGNLYSKKVSWADVTVNNVPLEQTFRYEDEISHVENSVDNTDKGHIIVNERRVSDLNDDDDDGPAIHQKKKWMNRLDKVTMVPVTLPQAKKKKRGHQRFPVKPKSKNEVREEKINCSSDKFHELIDKNSSGILGSFIYTICCKDGYEKIVSWDDGDDFGFNVKKEVRYQPKFKNVTYCPPEHWLIPVIQWDKIWREMDEIQYGYKRDYVYVAEGDELCTGIRTIMGPAIHFFSSPCETEKEYEKYWNSSMYKHWITATNEGPRLLTSPPDSHRLSYPAYLERVEEVYLENPSNETFKDYQDGWLLTQPGHVGYYQRRTDGWIFKVFPFDHTKRNHSETAPQPHL
jgi:hypothetical protein